MDARLHTNIRRRDGQVGMAWREGKSRKGRELWGCLYWPNSESSVEAAHQLAYEYRRDQGLIDIDEASDGVPWSDALA